MIGWLITAKIILVGCQNNFYLDDSLALGSSPMIGPGPPGRAPRPRVFWGLQPPSVPSALRGRFTPGAPSGFRPPGQKA